MCGIAGCVELSGVKSDLNRIGKMTEVLHHRGPDGGDVWKDSDACVAFGHRRLSIIDVTDAGRQPMHSSCGRFVITYNGEVYNAAELRAELQRAGRSFRGHSDTEVIVEACSVWGIEATAKRLVGMFAMGIWDRKARELSLVRDRLGIKPLYWSLQKGLLLFGSELKAFRTVPEFDSTICRDAVLSFLKHNCIGGTQTIYAGAQKLASGHILSIQENQVPDIRPYWSLDYVIADGDAAPFQGGDEDAIDALEAILGDAVERRMISDVPLGAFLSGGIDSSTVVALMQKVSKVPVRTFSIGFDEAGYNEAKHAALVARHLGTDHTELYVSSSQAMDVIPKLPQMYDEPFADSSQIPTYLVSALTREHVTVSLSGDGGDELFAGYNRYVQAKTLMRFFWSLPSTMRAAFAGCMQALPPHRWNALLKHFPVASKMTLPGDKLHKLGDVLRESKEGFYPRLVTHWANGPEMICGSVGDQQHGAWGASKALTGDFIERMQYADTLTYLPDDILTKVDRASMAVSLEARVPLLDHRVVEFSWSLPQHFKIRNGESKWILRQLLYRYVPKEMIDRPKMGFAVPIDHWLRGPLRDWAEDLLSEDKIKNFGIIDPAPVRQKWQEHLSGQRNWQYLLWDILMLQAWCEEWI